MTPLHLGPYSTVPDYIYGITREIWEERGIGAKIAVYYADDCLVRAATGITTNNRGIASQTLQTLHQFPDRQLVGEDVIWREHAEKGFLSSHRLISVMRHQGEGSYGAATNRVVRSRIIADCWIVNGQVKEEWLVRDQAAFARCMGVQPCDLARAMVEHDLRHTGSVQYFTPDRDILGEFKPEREPEADIAGYAAGWTRIWQAKETAAIRELYFPGASLFVPGGDVLNGHADFDRFCIGYLASFPDSEFRFESFVVNRDPGQPLRVATRWSLSGTHSGFGHFGAPTGAPVYIMGLSHAHLVEGRVHSEWIVTDEVAVWKQILAHAKDPTGAR